MRHNAIGIDFGTSNSSVALALPGGEVRMAVFPFAGTMTDSYRSLLYLEQEKVHGRNVVKSWSGPAGIERYLDADDKGRLIQSLKSFLTSRTLKGTEIFGRMHTLEELVSRILRDLKGHAEAQFGVSIGEAVVGRPVEFVGAEKEADNRHAEGRLREAFRMAGFDKVSFQLEPVGAAYHYESTLERDELLLIGDFGGGTSDFTLIRVGPGVRKRGRKKQDLLGHAGLGLAGDTFDAKIIHHLVSPALGAGTQLRSVDKLLPVPVWIYAKLERWHHLSFLKTKETMEMIRVVQAQALEPEKIAALLHLIREDLGYRLHQSVQAVKRDLSSHTEAMFRFSDGDVSLDATVKRSDFELWIGEELERIRGCVDGLLGAHKVEPGQVDRVFLTGGTSFVPAVRRIFEERFGAAKIQTGDEFTSVARGLALQGVFG